VQQDSAVALCALFRPATAQRASSMKRSSAAALEEEESGRSHRRCIERSLWVALDKPASVLLEHCPKELKSVFAQHDTSMDRPPCGWSIERLITRAHEDATTVPDLDALRLDTAKPAAATAAAPVTAVMDHIPSPTTSMASLPSLPGLGRQRSFCPSLLTESALAEDSASTLRCVNAIARLARRCGALSGGAPASDAPFAPVAAKPDDSSRMVP